MSTLLTYALTTVADVKESMGIASGDHSLDNLIIRKINQATKAIENYCGRRFLETTYTQEAYNATLSDQIILRNRPITTTTPIVLDIRDTSLNSADFETVESTLYFQDAESGLIDLNFRASGNWSRFRITYSAGYATIPEDLAEACATLAAFYVNNADGSSVGVTQKREGQRQVNYSTTNQDFDTVIEALGIDGIINSYANLPIMTNR